MLWRFSAVFSTFVYCLAVAGCATTTAPKKGLSSFRPEELLQSACEVGRTIQGVKGNASIKVASPEASGQLPASVSVSSPDQLRLEVMNLLGGTEAFIKVDGEKYEMTSSRGKVSSRKEGDGTWAGIPLRWAVELFLGRIPCPSEWQKKKPKRSSSDQLEILDRDQDGNTERFVYRFTVIQNQPWAESLVWEKKGSISQKVNFEFENADEKTLSPLRWEAKSSSGTIKVRWRERRIESRKSVD